MISILSMVKTGQYKDFIKIRFEFEFDDASLLPIGTYTWGVKTYFIEEGSKARDTINNIYYEYIKGKWSKIITSPIPTFKTPKNTTYTDNGEYSVSNNDFVGFNDIKVDVSSTPSTLIEKSITENNTYNASDDGVDGYSKVTVDVSNTYTAQDEGKVVLDGTLVAQTAMQEEVTENGTINTTLYNSVTVNVSGGGGGGSLSDDVIFFDYDGSVVASYSATDFANLTAMPSNPTHTGLTAQGWNWSLADAKTYVAQYRKLNVGQMYITSDGKTRFYFTVPKEYLEVYLHLVLNENAELDIDWGDGSEHTTWTYDEYVYDKPHTYASAGRYVIAITVVTGSFEIGDENSENPETLPGIYKAELGSGVTVLSHAAFYVDSGSRFIYSLTSITMPNTITSIGDTAFGDCGLLRFITIPSGVTSIDDSAFNECNALEHIAIPNTITRIGSYAFYRCCSLSSLTLPNELETIGDYTLMDCELLSSITIPNGVTSLEGLYFYKLLRDIVFGSSIPPVNDDSSKFNNLSKACIIHVPQGSLSEYTSAEYYPDPSQYIYEEY